MPKPPGYLCIKVSPEERRRLSERAELFGLDEHQLISWVIEAEALDKSDRLFRAAHITAMAETIFGSNEKAKRWLNKPKARFNGLTPMALLLTSQGTRQVEEMLLQVTEGYAF